LGILSSDEEEYKFFKKWLNLIYSYFRYEPDHYLSLYDYFTSFLKRLLVIILNGLVYYK